MSEHSTSLPPASGRPPPAVDSPPESGVTAADLSASEDSPRVAWSDAAPVVSAGGFDQPVDWLLEIVWASKIDLAGLPIAPLIEALATAMFAAGQSGVFETRPDREGK